MDICSRIWFPSAALNLKTSLHEWFRFRSKLDISFLSRSFCLWLLFPRWFRFWLSFAHWLTALLGMDVIREYFTQYAIIVTVCAYLLWRMRNRFMSCVLFLFLFLMSLIRSFLIVWSRTTVFLCATVVNCTSSGESSISTCKYKNKYVFIFIYLLK